MDRPAGQPASDRPTDAGGLEGGGRHQPVRPGARPVRHGHADRHPHQDAARAGRSRRQHRCRVPVPARSG
ncbi:hypothetical protein G6F63_016459 [Rhizopus arrhizus]|nr:hypothetical protein G6F63_016459 [Rhizopus arrhizus]